ncbi:MAG: LamB/YcsF family protein [Actinobacteria bacterium]|nr:LamB/YcsF family protein [Actinomycetota bacterium]
MRIDLNADLGEGFGVWQLTDDEALLRIVTSANVACGFHAGDPVTMTRVCASAARLDVAIGAQVSYRDLIGFGRRRLDVGVEELKADILYQLGALAACARAAGTRVRYVKPHGALYNTAADDPRSAAAIASAMAAFDPAMPLLGLPGSALADAADAIGIPFVTEAFADRRYTAHGRLQPRGAAGAVLAEIDDVVAQAVSIVRDGRARADDGAAVDIRAESICVHGDTPDAVPIARAVRAALTAAGADVTAFTA